MNIFEQLRRDEGERKFPYRDSAGNLTIGIGRNLSVAGLSEAEINALLQNDVEFISNSLEMRLPWFANIDPVRQAVLINMGFNLGFNGLERFPKFLEAMAQGDWLTASNEMLASTWAIQVGDRANRLAKQILTGEWV